MDIELDNKLSKLYFSFSNLSSSFSVSFPSSFSENKTEHSVSVNVLIISNEISNPKRIKSILTMNFLNDFNKANLSFFSFSNL